MTGRLAGIARHDRPKGPMEAIAIADVTISEGVHGDYRGALASAKRGAKRQVSVIERESWQAAQADCGCMLEWWHARRNLLTEGVRLPREVGARIAIGPTLVLEVTGECDPCERMEALHAGLRAAMTPDWRGGVLARVITDGHVAPGDEVRIV